MHKAVLSTCAMQYLLIFFIMCIEKINNHVLHLPMQTITHPTRPNHTPHKVSVCIQSVEPTTVQLKYENSWIQPTLIRGVHAYKAKLMSNVKISSQKTQYNKDASFLI